jgi:hypothetical protein
MDQTAANRQLQTELYGEPLGDLIRRISSTLRLTQAKVAEVIGLSAPMLSQLMSAQRVKIGNPAVVARLQTLEEFASRPGVEQLPQSQIETALDTVRDTTGAFTGSSPRTAPRVINTTARTAPVPMTTRSVVREFQELLREVASAEEIQRAAALIGAESPRLAELLTVYGTGRTDDAVAHFERRSG